MSQNPQIPQTRGTRVLVVQGLAVQGLVLPWPRPPSLWLPSVFSSLKYKQDKCEAPHRKQLIVSPSPVTMETRDARLSQRHQSD